MRPRVFVVQPIPEVALDILREVADVRCIRRWTDRSPPGASANAAALGLPLRDAQEPHHARSDLANPNLKGIGIGGRYAETVDLAACDERNLPLLTSPPQPPGSHSLVSVATADLTVAMVLSLAYRLHEADRYTREGGFRQEQTMALMGLGCTGKRPGSSGWARSAR